MSREMRRAREAALYEVIVEVRQLFHKMANAADELHRDVGISAGQRGLLERLTTGGPATVPMIAREKAVSRQHIQTLANHLLAEGLVEATKNPAHQRSALLTPTQSGRRSFEAIRSREAALLGPMSEKLATCDFAAVAEGLRQIGGYLDGEDDQ